MNRDEIIRQCYLVPGQTWPTELGWLFDELQHSKTHAEIGTFCGRSLLASCGGMAPGSVVVSVDDASEWSNREWVESVQAATISLVSHVSIRTIRANSIDAARSCFASGLKFDSVFIDGCHEYAECKADIEEWRALIRPGGLICGHDYWPVHTGVMDAVNECVPGFKLFAGTRIWWAKTIERPS